LLVAQLNNQDPLNPMDNAQMTSQMAQINTVSGIQELNATLKGMAAQFSSTSALQATSPIGREPLLPGPALALPTAKPALRGKLLPRGPGMDPADLVEAGERYARSTGYPVQYQWTLLAGINDGADELEGIVRLLKGRYAVLNMIPYNQVDGLDFERPSWERAAEIARLLHRQGVLTKLRQSAGQDVEGGCGQLRARALAPSAAPAVVRWQASRPAAS